MWNVLQKISKNIFIIGIVLYVFGFLVVNSFLSSFGIVDFNIINVRYLIAGFLGIISLILAISLAWQLYRLFKISGFRRNIKSLKMFWYIFMFPVGIHLLSIGLLNFLNIGKFHNRLMYDIRFIPIFKNFLGRYDFGEMIINKFNLTNSVSDSMEKMFLYILFYIIVLFIQLIVLYLAFRILKIGFIKIFKFKPGEGKDKKVNTKTEEEKRIEKEEEEKNDLIIYKSATANFIFLFLFMVVVAEYSIMLIYSFLKILNSIFDYSVLGGEFITLSTGIIFSWLFLMMSSLVFLFLILKIPIENKMCIKEKKEYFSKIFSSLYNDPYNFLISLSFCLLFILFFGWTIYPRIPSSIGGGEPREIIVISKSLNRDLESGKTYIISDSDDYISVVFKNEKTSKTIQFNKDDIISISYDLLKK